MSAACDAETLQSNCAQTLNHSNIANNTRITVECMQSAILLLCIHTTDTRISRHTDSPAYSLLESLPEVAAPLSLSP